MIHFFFIETTLSFLDRLRQTYFSLISILRFQRMRILGHEYGESQETQPKIESEVTKR